MGWPARPSVAEPPAGWWVLVLALPFVWACNLAPLAPGTYLCGDGGSCLPGAVCIDDVCVAAPATSGTASSTPSASTSSGTASSTGSSSGLQTSSSTAATTASSGSTGASTSSGSVRGSSTGSGSTSGGSTSSGSTSGSSSAGTTTGGSSSGGTTSGSSGSSSGAPAFSTLSVLAGQVDGTAFNTVAGLAYDGSRYVYAVDSGNCVIRQVDTTTGVISTLAGSPGICSSFDGVGPAARFYYPEGIAYDGHGNLFVADTGNYTIRQIVIYTQSVTTLAGQARVQGSADGVGPAAQFFVPYGVTADGHGNLFIADSGNQTVRQLVISTEQVTTLAGVAQTAGAINGTGSAARFYNLGGITNDGAGNIYVADCGNYAIRQVTADGGVVTTLAGAFGVTGSTNGVGTAARFLKPQQVAYDPTGYLYVADQSNFEVRQIEISTATVTTVAGVIGQSAIVTGPLPGDLESPFGVAISLGSPLFISDQTAEVILEAD